MTKTKQKRHKSASSSVRRVIFDPTILPPKMRIKAERLRAEAQAHLDNMKPFRQWCKERKRTADDIAAYWMIRREWRREAMCPSPRWVTFENGLLVGFGY